MNITFKIKLTIEGHNKVLTIYYANGQYGYSKVNNFH